MKLALLVVAFPLASFAGVPVWRVVDSGTTEPLWGVATLDDSTAVAVGWHGTILRTEDGGETWTPQKSNTGNNLYAVSFGDSLHGTAVGYDSSTSSALILHTDDRGFTWAPQDSGLQYVVLQGVQFLDALTGTAVGSNTTILRTEDGGQRWQLQLNGLGPYPTLWSVYFTDAKHGTAVGWWWRHQPESFILATSDGGATWEIRELDPRLNFALFGVAFADPLNGIAVGEAGVVLFTIDGGASWQPELGARETLRSVAFADGQSGVAVGWPTTLWTRDGGRSWIEVENRLNFLHVAFFDPDRAIAVGGGGLVALSK